MHKQYLDHVGQIKYLWLCYGQVLDVCFEFSEACKKICRDGRGTFPHWEHQVHRCTFVTARREIRPWLKIIDEKYRNILLSQSERDGDIEIMLRHYTVHFPWDWYKAWVDERGEVPNTDLFLDLTPILFQASCRDYIIGRHP